MFLCNLCGEAVPFVLDKLRDHLESHHPQARKFDAEEVESFFSEEEYGDEDE